MEWVALVLLVVLWRVHASALNRMRREQHRQDELIRSLTRRVYELERSKSPLEPEPASVPEPASPPIAVEPAVAAHVPAGAPEPEPQPALLDRVRERLRGQEWEAIIGGSWLNAVGVLVLVIGISLFLGYALTELGPPGKIAIGLLVSVGMLAGGILVERRQRYVIFARGLLAGGWAALYFTIYAMHAIQASRIIESPFAGGVLLLAAGCGMIGHSLKYRSQNLTLLAYFTAYLALQLEPVSALSVAAGIPLAVSLLTISRELDWPHIPVAGMLLTYFTFAFRFDAREVGVTLGVAALYSYWLAFEIYDLLKVRAAARRSLAEMSVFPLNALMFLGTAMLTLPPSTPVQGSNFLATAGAVFLISTVLRMRWKAALLPESRMLEETLGQSHRIALSLAAALFAFALLRRFPMARAEIGLLLEAQLLVLAGLRFGERFFCRVAGVLFAASVLRLATGGAGDTRIVLVGHSYASWLPFCFWMPVQFYFNRRLTRSGHLYTWGAAALLAAGAAELLKSQWAGVAWAALAVALLEVFLRTGLREFLGQAVLVAVAAFFAQMDAGVNQGWGAALFYLAALRVHGRGVLDRVQDGALVLGTVLAASAMWLRFPAAVVALGWGLLAIVMLEIGWVANLPVCRWLGHALAFSAFARAFVANLTVLSSTAGISHRLLTVAPLIGLAGYGWRRFRESLVSRGYCWAATILAVALLRFELGRTLAVVGWAALMLVLLHFGLKSDLRDWRAQSYVLAALTFARGWATNFTSRESLLGMPERVATGLLVIAAFHVAQFRSPRQERFTRPALAVLGSALLSILLFYEVSGRLLTISWGAQGIATLMAGFYARERILRFGGLGLFLVCILKLFFYDLRELDTPSRILSFIVLGLVMMGASWLYMRFRDNIQRFL